MDDQRDMLQGTAGEARADSLLAAYGVDAVFVNAALPLPISEFGSRVDAKWVDRALARFSRDPQRFPVLYNGPEGLVVAVMPAAASPATAAPATAAASPTVVVVPMPQAVIVPPPQSAAPDSSVVVSGPFAFHGLEASDVRLPARPVSRGDWIRIPLSWRRTGDLGTDLPLTAQVRMQTDVPSRWFSHRLWNKPARLLTQRIDRRVYRHRVWSPLLQGSRNPARLPVGSAFPDTLMLPIPTNAAPGEWTVTLAVYAESFLPNYRLRDLVSDEDGFTGAVIGRVTVRE
jgi:hypothetical protein